MKRSTAQARSAVAPNSTTGIGTPKMKPWPSVRKPGESRGTGIPSLAMKVRPRATLNMPSVATNGGTRSRATSAPLTMPRPSPAPTPSAIATSGLPGFAPVTSDAPRMPHTASSEPTDRSMPPVRITKVWPMARMPLMLAWRSTLMMLSGVRKYGLSRLSAAHSAKNATTMP